MTDTKHQLDKIKNTFDRANARMEAAVEGIIKLREERDALRELNLELVKALRRAKGGFGHHPACSIKRNGVYCNCAMKDVMDALKHAEEVLK